MNKVEAIEIIILLFFLAIPFIVGYTLGKRAGYKEGSKFGK